MVDTYGDGWQSDTGNGGTNPITIEVEDANGNITSLYAGMCSNYEPFTVDSCEPSSDKKIYWLSYYSFLLGFIMSKNQKICDSIVWSKVQYKTSHIFLTW